MADQRRTAASPNDVRLPKSPVQEKQPLNRRRALRVLGALAAAAAGAAALSASRPEEAIASYGLITSADPTATYEFDNTGSGSGVWGRSTSLLSSPSGPPFPDAGVSGTAGADGQGVAGGLPEVPV